MKNRSGRRFTFYRFGLFGWAFQVVPCALTCAIAVPVLQVPVAAQTTAQAVAAVPGGIAASCGLQAPSFSTSGPNIFNAQQEQDLGDAIAEELEPELRLVPPGKEDQLTRIGQRLLATLPVSGMRYQFRIYESGEFDGFSIAGGRVYISRKLITAIKNEDELAGVLAHEIGHISTHQSAIMFTRLFRVRLGVTQVTDRADIFAKVHKLWSTAPKPGEFKDEEQKDQLVADRVGLYTMLQAGYAPESFALFLDKISVNKGKRGSWLTDVFGSTGEAALRFRAAEKLISALTPDCRSKQPGAGEAFLAWQRNLVEERGKTETEAAEGDKPVKLDPPLRPSLWRIRFSPNGRYILAQDDGSVTVVDRQQGKVLFRIDAPDAEQAQFTPDSQSVVFYDTKLRVERWDVATGKRTSVKEMVVFDGCTQSLLSPDGRTLVCVNLDQKADFVDLHVRLRLIDVDSGNTLNEQKNFFTPGNYRMDAVLSIEGMLGTVAKIVVSPDGKYLVVTVVDRAFFYNLETRQPVAVEGKLKSLGQTRMAFLGPDQLYVVGDAKGDGLNKAQILSFPDGRLLKESEIGEQQIESVTKGALLIVSPLKNFQAGLMDPAAAQIKGTSKLDAIDGWENLVAEENATGGLIVGEPSVKGVTEFRLPLGPLPRPRAAAFSPDGRFLAVSTRSRGEVWNLQTGSKVTLLRPFRSAWMTEGDHLFVQFTKFLDRDPLQFELSLDPLTNLELGKYEEDDWQYHEMQYVFKPMGKDRSTNHHAVLEVKKMGSATVAWKREFAKETPACWEADDNRLLLAWDLTNDAAKQEIKQSAVLQHEMESLGGKKSGLLLETVSAETGAVLEQVVLPEGDLTGGRADERRARVAGDTVLVRGEHDNTVIYRLKDGSKVGEFFGLTVATNARLGLVAAVNRDVEEFLVDTKTGKELKRYTLGSPVRLTRIVDGGPGQGKEAKALLVLTSDQVVHRLPLPE